MGSGVTGPHSEGLLEVRVKGEEILVVLPVNFSHYSRFRLWVRRWTGEVLRRPCVVPVVGLPRDPNGGFDGNG